MPARPLQAARQHVMSFERGPAIGLSHAWNGGQFCAIFTPAGIVGCGIFDMGTPTKFGQAIAIARGTPELPLVTPDDLCEAKIVECTPAAREMGIEPGMTGRDGVERMLAAGPAAEPAPRGAMRVKSIDHVTFVVADLDRSRTFYRDVLGMDEVPRPAFSFPGLWFQAGGTQIHLILEHPETGPAAVRIPDECKISRTRHVAFEVDDAAFAVRRLAELGVPIVAGPQQRPDGPTQMYVQDPDGNLIELFAYPPAT
ncbi:MAG: DUF1805 domain-containing protein [Planctomyces sp.]|nr:DUF1805 domain-containing protein [Planctomyces sp.]